MSLRCIEKAVIVFQEPKKLSGAITARVGIGIFFRYEQIEKASKVTKDPSLDRLWFQRSSNEQHSLHKGQCRCKFWEFSGKGSFGTMTFDDNIYNEIFFQYI